MTEGNNNIFLAGNDTLGYLVRPMHKKYSMACILGHPFTCGSYDRVLDLSHTSLMCTCTHLEYTRLMRMWSYRFDTPLSRFNFACLPYFPHIVLPQKFRNLWLTYLPFVWGASQKYEVFYWGFPQYLADLVTFTEDFIFCDVLPLDGIFFNFSLLACH